MKKLIIGIVSLFILSISQQAIAQSPCANMSITLVAGTLNQPCDTNQIVNFTVEADINTNFSVLETDTYSVNQIPYNPYPFVGANTFSVTTDDIWSPVYPIPFKFCFFGQSYSQFVIGSNGQISFNPSRAGQYDNWSTNGFIAPFNHVDMNNTIMGCYHDIDYNIGGTATWDTIGVAPCRKLIINWTSVPMFSCNTMLDTQQVVLHEFTNIIEFNLASKPLCATWNGGVAHQGIQNNAATTAYMVPGRNGTQWGPLNNDSWQIAPAGTPYTFQKDYFWYHGVTNALLATGQNFSMSSPFPPYVICKARVIGGCNSDTTWAQDTLFFLPGKVTADFIATPHLGCDLDTVVLTNTSTPGATSGTSYYWTFGDGTNSVNSDPTHIYGTQNVYTITLIANNPLCESDTAEVVVNLNHPIDAAFSIANTMPNTNSGPDSVCLGYGFIFTPILVPSNVFFPGLLSCTWDMGDGNVFTNQGDTICHYTYTKTGAFEVKLIVTDTLGCQDSISQWVYVDATPYAQMTVTPSEICLGQPVYFSDSVAPHTISTTYDFNDGNILGNVHNPKHTYDAAGTYDATYTAHYLVCPDFVVTRTIIVHPYPLINLGPDTALCPGLSGSITLSNLANPAQILNWSDGSTGPSLTLSELDFGYYWAQASDGNCTATDSIWVKRDCYLNIPNSFSPNGDGLNDYFIPRQLLSSGVVGFSMKIFNRWGEKIYETTNIDGRGWDGKYGGKDQPAGVYVYLIEAQWKNNFRNSFQGNVSLLR